MRLPRTKADLTAYDEFMDLSRDTGGNPCVWRNHYECDRCATAKGAKVTWTMDWSCACNDRCPVCHAETEASRSEWLPGGGRVAEAVWENLPDAGVDMESGEAHSSIAA